MFQALDLNVFEQWTGFLRRGVATTYFHSNIVTKQFLATNKSTDTKVLDAMSRRTVL